MLELGTALKHARCVIVTMSALQSTLALPTCRWSSGSASSLSQAASSLRCMPARPMSARVRHRTRVCVRAAAGVGAGRGVKCLEP